MRKLALTLVPLLLLACGQEPPTTAASANMSLTESTEMYRLVGQGRFWDGDAPEMVLNVIRHFDGQITGQADDPRFGYPGLAPVVGITAPSEAYPWWCVEIDESPDDSPLRRTLFYVKDNDGLTTLDEVSRGVYLGGCAQYPGSGAFSRLVSGDFKGTVRTR